MTSLEERVEQMAAQLRPLTDEQVEQAARILAAIEQPEVLANTG